MVGGRNPSTSDPSTPAESRPGEPWPAPTRERESPEVGRNQCSFSGPGEIVVMTDMSTDLLHLNQATCSTSSVRRGHAYRWTRGTQGCRPAAARGRGRARRHRRRRPALTAALAAYAADPAREPEVLAALAEARLLVPVVAELARRRPGRTVWCTTSPATWRPCSCAGSDGRLALLAFTGLEAMRRWNPDARPVPVPARTAALAAMQDGAEALLIDLAGPVRYLVHRFVTTGIVGYHRALTDLCSSGALITSG